jgi:hypothetical protein
MNFSAHLALIELYSLTGRTDLATRTIEHLMYVTSNRSLEALINDELLQDPEFLIYRPDLGKILPAIKENLFKKANEINRLTVKYH